MSYASELLEAFHCDDADLEANREGALSEAQSARANAATRGDAWFNAGFAILFAAVMYGVLWFIVDSGKLFDFAEGVSFAEVVILLVAGGLPTLALLWAVNSIRVHLKSRDAVAVSSVEGTARLSEKRWKGAVLQEVTVAGETFALTPQAFSTVREREPVRLYFVPTSRVVVGAEPVD